VKTLIAGILAGVLLASSAQAASTIMRKGQELLFLWCDSGSCYVRKTPTGTIGLAAPKTIRLGKGGQRNFDRWVKKYHKRGYQ
jgi:hypothetical protein